MTHGVPSNSYVVTSDDVPSSETPPSPPPLSSSQVFTNAAAHGKHTERLCFHSQRDPNTGAMCPASVNTGARLPYLG